MEKQLEAIDDVIEFWENNPLFSGESKYKTGTKDFFEEHREVYLEDVFAGYFDDKKYIPKNLENSTVLDLGCGVGFWTIEILKRRKCNQLYYADITENALVTTGKRLELYDLTATPSKQNVELLTFENEFFDHINCQGVIHHTPDTSKALEEIARVLKKGGTASISVYYRNIFLRNWKYFSAIGKLLAKLGAGLKGRGRESIFNENNVDEITRLYDGSENPIGKSYSMSATYDLVPTNLKIEKKFLFFFPARSFPIPGFFHRFCAATFGFMIHLNLRKI